MAELCRRLNDIEQIFEASDIQDATAHPLWSEWERIADTLYCATLWISEHIKIV